MARMAQHMYTRALITALASALAMLGPVTAAAEIRTIKIHAEEFRFVPSRAEIEQGQSIRLKLVNDGNLSHNIHLKRPGLKTQTIQSGSTDTIEFTAEQTGIIHFFCNVPGHRQAGMEGRLIIE